MPTPPPFRGIGGRGSTFHNHLHPSEYVPVGRGVEVDLTAEPSTTDPLATEYSVIEPLSIDPLATEPPASNIGVNNALLEHELKEKRRLEQTIARLGKT